MVEESARSRSHYYKAMNVLIHWKKVLVGWQIGTTTDQNSTYQAIADHRASTLVHRAEITTLVALLIDKGIFTMAEFEEQCALEAYELSRELERRFPGFKATEEGLSMDPKKAVETTKGWPR